MTQQQNTPHARWAKSSHWIVTVSFFALSFTGVEMVMVHPRFYWGEVGNDLTPALFEIPISRNYRHNGWENTSPFYDTAGAPVSSSRTYDIFNQNGWGRSLHFLAAWVLVIAGLVYLLAGVFSGHFRRNLLPKNTELNTRRLRQELADHFRMRIPAATGGPQYGLLQKLTYVSVIFIALPVSVMTGLGMSPAIVAAYPFLTGIWGGAQSARTVHLFASVLLVLFLLVHLVMIIRSGFKPHMRAMTFWK